MVSVAVDVAGCEIRIDQYRDVGESRRQEDRRGPLAVESGPPMRGSGGVADKLVPLPVDAGDHARGQAPGVLYTGSALRGEVFRIARPVCLPPAAPGLLQRCRAVRSPDPCQPTHFRSLGGVPESTEAVLSLAGTGGGDLIRHHH